MNVNEVIAKIASDISETTVHPNDHVNMCQSSNDAIPSAIHVSATLLLVEELLPAMQHLADTIGEKATEIRML